MSKRMIENDCLILSDENGGKILMIRESFDGDRVTLALDGNINMNVAHDFEDELTAAATVCNQIIVDFEHVEVISSVGIKALLMVQRILDKRTDSMLKLTKMKKEVYEMFEEMGFVDLFDIEN